MNLKSAIVGIVTIGIVGMSAGASAWEHRGGPKPYFDHARVVDVQPVYKVVRVNHPERECWDEPVAHRERAYRSKTPVVVGGIIGGVVGSRIGEGRGRDLATVAGTLLGASIGNDINRTNHPDRTYVSHETMCRTVDHFVDEERPDGYQVTYRYHGRTYVTRTDHDPGKRIRVRVRISPVL